MRLEGSRSRWTVVAATIVLTACDVVTQADDVGRTGWYPVTAITRQLVAGGAFGQRFHTTVSGAVYAQPLVLGNTVLVATESNNVYGIDPSTGALHWSRNLGVAFNPGDIGCPDPSGTYGVKGTPVIDRTTGTAYMVSETYASGTSGPPAFLMHALDVATGAERNGFPVRIAGTAANIPGLPFLPTEQDQRPGLVLVDGVVYSAYASACDQPPYSGWVIGVSTAGAVTTLWSAAPSNSGGPGIWQSAGGLASDGPGQILLVTGNGHANITPRPGSQPGTSLGEAVVRLSVQPDRTLRPVDFFSPFDAATLDSVDNDLGSGAPALLPPTPFSTPAHRELLAVAGKEGLLYLLDAHDLGGMRQGPYGTDRVLQRLGDYRHNYGKIGVWPGDGGYVYLLPTFGMEGTDGDNHIHAFRFGVDGSGNPTLTHVATSAEAMGYGSTAATVSSQGRSNGTALLWVVDREGAASRLRAYDAVPANGTLTPVWSAPIGNASKFSAPAIRGDHLYLGTLDGQLFGFGPN